MMTDPGLTKRQAWRTFPGLPLEWEPPSSNSPDLKPKGKAGLSSACICPLLANTSTLLLLPPPPHPSLSSEPNLSAFSVD